VTSFFRKNQRPLDAAGVGKVIDALSEKVYLSLDMDAFDPAFAPATGTPEPGGLDWAEFSLLVRELARKKTLVAMDVCEVKPVEDDVRTEILAARAVLRVMAWTGGDLAEPQRLQFPSHGGLVQRDAEFLPYPLRQVFETPADYPMDRRDRPVLDDLRQCPTLLPAKLRRRTRCLAVNQPVNPTTILRDKFLRAGAVGRVRAVQAPGSDVLGEPAGR